MSVIKKDFSKVPNEVPTIEPGIYEGRVVSAETRDYTSKKGEARTSLDVAIQLTSDGPFQGRQVRDQIDLVMDTRIKQLALACGVAEAAMEQGLETADLVGKVCRFRTNLHSYVPAGQTEQRQIANIVEYLWKA